MKNISKIISDFKDIVFPWRKQVRESKKQIEELQDHIKKLYDLDDKITINKNKIEELTLYTQGLFSEKHELIIEDREKLEELKLYTQKLFSEKHELIIEDRKKIEELDMYTQKLFSEKHEMIIKNQREMEELSLYMQKLFTEKHEMILEDRKEILNIIRKNIIEFYRKNPDDTKVMEVEFLENNDVQMYPYDWTREYEKSNFECFQDADGYFWVDYKGKKLFFPLTFSEEMVKNYYTFLLMEQDDRSPHKYFGKDFVVNESDVFVDVGAAEGMISLDIIDSVKRVIIFECDNNWLNALHKTFEIYGEKVEIIPKFVGNTSSDKEIKLCDVLDKAEKYIFKIDVEGNEMRVLEGMKGIQLNAESKILICCYHNQVDEKLIVEYMDREDMEYEFTDGFLLSVWGGYEEPYFRRGICRAYCKG